MLNMYDLLLEKNQPIVEVYLLNIQDFLSTFCVQLDASSSRVMTAEVNNYVVDMQNTSSVLPTGTFAKFICARLLFKSCLFKGSGYTTIQAQSLVPGSKNFSVSSYTIAGEFAKVVRIIRFFYCDTN